MSITRKGQSEGVVSRGPTTAERVLDITTTRKDVVTELGGTTEQTEQDHIYDVGITSEYDVGWEILASNGEPIGGSPIVAENLNTDTATLTKISDGRWQLTNVSEGMASVVIRTQNCSRRVDRRVWHVPSGEFKRFNRYAVGSLAKHASDSIDTMINGKTPATAKPMFSAINHNTSSYTRNTNCWMTADMTGISVWNSAVPKRHVTAITPLHVAFCAHWGGLHVGSTCRFITNDNQVIERTIAATKIHPDFAMVWPDIQIARLSSPLPETILPIPLLPVNWEDYLPSQYYLAGVPIFTSDQDCNAIIESATGFTTTLNHIALFYEPIESTRKSFYELLIVGDSGNPDCLIINGELVLLGTTTTPSQCTSFHAHVDDINQLIDDVGKYDQELTFADLSGFTDFSE